MAPKTNIAEPTMADEEQALVDKLVRSRKKLTAAAITLVLLLNAGFGYWLYNRWVLDAQAANLQQLSQQYADDRASSVQRYFSEFQRSLGGLQRPALVQALLDNNQNTLKERAERTRSERDEVLSVRIFGLGQADLDRKHSYPIHFAQLDMIHRTEKGEKVMPEASKFGGKWLIYSTLPLYKSQQKPIDTEQADKNKTEAATKTTIKVVPTKILIGTALVVSQLTPLKQLLAQSEADHGLSELLQSFNPRKPDVIVSAGINTGNVEQNSEQGSHKITAQAVVASSHWVLRFTPAQYLVEQTVISPVMTMFITLLSTLIGIIAAIFAAKYTAQQQLHKQVQQAIASRATQKGRSAKRATGKRSREDIHRAAHADVLDVKVINEDKDILGLNEQTSSSASAPVGSDAADVPEQIFRSYDIRGLAETEITAALATKIGRALGSEALDQGESSMVVARDGRNSSPELCQALVEGILSSGCDVINLGITPSPFMYFATHHLENTSSGVIVTASHNPSEYNGFKIIINGTTLADDTIQDVRARILRGQFHGGQGSEVERDIMPDYIDRILADVALAGDVHIVIDAGNGATSEAAPTMFDELGCEVTPLYCEFDGDFPNHQPDPSRSENLQDLIKKVQEVGADIGVAFDGDGDRLTIVTPKGRIIWPDQLLMLYARDIVSTNPGTDVLFDVKCTRLLNQLISSYGGRPIMWKTGHSHMKAKMIETGALLGGEFSGHIFIKHRWYGFDDGIYACARLLEIMTLRDEDIDTLIDAFPVQESTEEILVATTDENKFKVIERLIASGDFPEGERTTIDGLRVDFDKGWGLVRASNTSANLTLRFEAESKQELEQLKILFKRELSKIDGALELNF